MSANIDALPLLPDPTEAPPPDADVDLPLFEGSGETAPADTSTVTPMAGDLDDAPVAAAAPPTRGFQDMQRRIGRLFAQKRGAEEAAEVERQRAEALEARLRELEARAAASQYAPPRPAPAPAEGFNPYAQPIPSPQPAPFDPRLFSGALQQALAPIVDRLNAREQIEALAGAHDNSWDAATEEFPEIAQGGSALRRTAEHLLRQDPELARSPNGPYRAVLLARGLLADAPRAAAAVQVRRNAGTATTAGPGDGRTLAQLQTEYAKLLKDGIFDARGWTRAQHLRQEIGALKQRKE